MRLQLCARCCADLRESLQEPLATLVVNKLRGNLKVIAVKAPGFGERKTSYLEDIAIMTGATMVKEELGVSLETATEEVFGTASKVAVGKEFCTIVAGARALLRKPLLV